jgi:hypothetical protein
MDKDSENELKNELQLFSRDFYDATMESKTFSAATLQKYAAHLNNILRRMKGGQSIAGLVKEWVAASKGAFVFSHMCLELGIRERNEKQAADMALRRLAEKQLVEEGDKRGQWKPKVVETEELDWQSANPEATHPVIWPLELQKIAVTCPKNVIMVAGEKNSGKTAFCLNTAFLNTHQEVWYFSSEMPAQELARRIRLFPNAEPFKKVHFHTIGESDLSDLVRPDAINIFDYLEMEGEFWEIGKYIRRIWGKLGKGIALVAIQKDPNAKWGRGGGFSNEKSRMYLTMKKGMVITEVVKDYIGDKSPDGRVHYFSLENKALMVKQAKLTKSNDNGRGDRPMATVRTLPFKKGDSDASNIPQTPGE